MKGYWTKPSGSGLYHFIQGRRSLCGKNFVGVVTPSNVLPDLKNRCHWCNNRWTRERDTNDLEALKA